MQRELLAESVLGDGRRLRIYDAVPADADSISAVILDAFGNRPHVDPPPPALTETPQRVRQALEVGFGVLATVDDQPAGVILISTDQRVAGIHRVSVRPSFQRLGIASAMVEVVLEVLTLRGFERAELVAREEFPAVLAWWKRHGFVPVAHHGTSVELARELPICIAAQTAEQTQQVGARLARLVRAGDVLIATGDLGAGKTTFTQGLGEAMGVAGAVISPTFVISRVHPATGSGPALVHVDAYRLGSAAELDDLDLDDTVASAVTVIEWGAGLAEGLSTDRLEIDLRRSVDPADETRWIFLTGIGSRWADLRTQWEAL